MFFFDSSESLSFMMAIFPATCSHNGNAIILNPSSTWSSTMEILLLNLAFYSGVSLLTSFSVLLLEPPPSAIL